MEHIKIIFFDIDGTLIDIHTKQISENTLYMLHRLRQRGILVCLATGRAPAALPRLEGVVFDAYLTFNGSLCYDGAHTIYSNPIPTPSVEKLIQNAAAIGRPVSIATRQRLAANGSEPDLEGYYAIARLELTVAPDFDEAARQEVYQVMLGCREPDHPAILKDVPGVKIVSSWDRAVDVIPANSGKEAGIRSILAYYGLTPEQAMAFGDGNNDIEMLRTVGTGVAMGNASDALKAVADDFCGPVTEDGVYHYCLRHGLL